MEKIKVLMVCASLQMGGAEKVTQSIALHAPTNEFEFHYLVFHREEGLYEAALMKQGCCIHRFPEPGENHLLFLHNLRQLIHAHRFHVVHAHTMFNCGLVMLCARQAGVPVRISHAHSALTGKRSIVKIIYETIMRVLILACSTELVACGIQAGERLYGKSPFQKRGLLVPNGITFSDYGFSQEARSRIRAHYHLEASLVLGHIGRMVPVKNQMFLLNLMPSLLKRNPKVRLLLIGDGEDRPLLEEKSRELGISNQIIFTGTVANTADYLSAMDVFLFPSLFEGMPLSLLEAQANGLPCVVSDAVPRDVFVTDLIHPLSLNAAEEQWCSWVLSLKRNATEHHQEQLLSSAYSSTQFASQILSLYQKGLRYD